MKHFNLTVVRIIAAIILFYSLLVMVGWIFSIDSLIRIGTEGVNMKFATAFTFFMSGISLWQIDLAMTGKKEIPQIVLPAIASIILLIMVAFLAGQLFKIDIGIDKLFLSEKEGESLYGMPAIPTMISFVLFGIGSIIALFEAAIFRKMLLGLGIIIFLFGALAAVGYLFNLPVFYYKVADSSVPMAFNTAILFVLLGLGVEFTCFANKYEIKL